MDERAADKLIAATYRVRTFATFALIMLGLFLLFAALGELKGLRYIGSGIAATDTITVSGEGVVYAVPDVAEFSVTVQNTAADVASAQSKATATGNDIIAYLKAQGVADADVQTTDYSIEPQYQYSQALCPQTMVVNGGSAGVSYCPPGKQTLTGYQVSQTLEVKVRDTSKAGTILAGVGSKGASQVSGLDFTVADETSLEQQARDKAITDAKAQAQTLAKSLDVSLVRITGFSEGSNPMPYRVEAMATGASSAAVAPAPELPTGQNKITSDVTLTYEIQ